jgi:hypothetical protein
LPVVLYGYDTWFLTLSDEYRLRIFDISMLRKIPGLERGKVTGYWKTVVHLGTSYLVILTTYYVGGEIKTNETGGACGTNGRQERCIQVFGRET